jgi:hypothetical protein
MLKHITLLGKLSLALHHWTLKRFFSRMLPHVIENIMPFSEKLPTVILAAIEDLGPFACGSIEVLNKSKIFGLRKSESLGILFQFYFGSFLDEHLTIFI